MLAPVEENLKPGGTFFPKRLPSAAIKNGTRTPRTPDWGYYKKNYLKPKKNL